MADLPNAAVKRILLANGVGRISATAVTLAAEAAQEFLKKLAAESARSAGEAKRKTIMDEDITAAKTALSGGRTW
ncbi:MAG: NFYB/HAP3 family transcription factor subunit [Planctomycetes bacterium]|nr:NFYB/HAP3 family transcription factor subunit [Planctomycetota bacterium]